MITLCATIQAAAAKPKRLSIVAYNGGIMLVQGFGPVIIDLAGLELPATVPILDGHGVELDKVLGSGTPKSNGRQLTLSVQLADTEAANRALEILGSGVELQASVGVEPLEASTLAAGANVEVNGQKLTVPAGGATLVRRGRLKEVSVLALGADSDTQVRIAASRGRGATMATEVETERGRVQKIIALTAEAPEIQAKAITEGWDETQTELEVLRARSAQLDLERLRAARPTVPVVKVAGHGSGESSRNILASAFLIRAGYAGIAEKLIGARAAQAGDELRAHSLCEIFAHALRMDCREVPRDRNEMIRAAFSTASLPVALGDAASKVALDAYREAKPTWRSFARIVNANNFKTQNLIRLVVGGEYKPLAPGGELTHGTLGEQPYTVKIDTKGKMFGIDRVNVINDDLGLFMDLARSLGKMGARSISDEVFKVLLLNKEPDGSTSFFTTARGNYVTGAATALSFDALSTGRATLAKQVDTEGRPVDLQARSLLAPPELETIGRALLTSEMVERNTSSADNLPAGNPFRGTLEGPQVEARLSNSKFTGYSAKAWYLFAAPSDGAVAVGFLDGRDMPTIEQAEAPFNVLGLQYRGYVDFGVSLCDYVAAYKAKGEA